MMSALSSHLRGALPSGPVEPIAIIGQACRLPGEIESPEDLWNLLWEERNAMSDVPPDRWSKEAFYHAQWDHPGTHNQTGGHFIKRDIREFDNAFFGINNMEAAAMDPQQRNILEVAFEALESAGVRLEDVSGANIGCYVANFTMDHLINQTKDHESMNRYTSVGMGLTILANRISHALDLQGPSVVLDTACSTSLYALHFACLALQANEIEGALVAGTNLLTSPEQQIATAKMGVLSPTSLSHWADESADGYSRADGVCAIYVKRLRDAIRDGDPIRSIIRGSALNSNGRTFGITLPSVLGQEKVIRKAYDNANLDPADTAYVECHGTGTAVGDPIEIEALGRVFGSSRQEPVLLASVKSNLGHSEAASGLTSIIKASMMLERGLVPPAFGVQKLNSNIKADEWNVKVVTHRQAWPQTTEACVRRASVNSFGYGGANGHVILESANNRQSQELNPGADLAPANPTSGDDVYPYLLPLSASADSSLWSRYHDLKDARFPSSSMSDLLYTQSAKRSQLSKRGFALLRSANGIIDFGHDFVSQADAEDVGTPSAITFVFTGQGAQYSGMGRSLYGVFEVFRNSLEQSVLDLACAKHAPNWSLIDALFNESEADRIHDADRSQTLCTALQIALVDLLESWNVRPNTCIGHSSGEIAAAYASRHLSRKEAIHIAFYRGHSVSQSTFKGAMMAASISEEAAKEAIDSAGLSSELVIACMNSSENTTLSGSESSIDNMIQVLMAQDIMARKLRTGGKAYHSFDMRRFGEKYQQLVSHALSTQEVSEGSKYSPRMISTVYGSTISGATARNPVYWRTNLEEPVRFLQALSVATSSERPQFVELGPHSTLALPIKQVFAQRSPEKALLYQSALKRSQDHVASSISLAGHLYLWGLPISFDGVNRGLGHSSNSMVLTKMPRYAWKHDTILWAESRASREFRFLKNCRHELLGSAITGTSVHTRVWKNNLRVKDVPWLADHQIKSSIIFPAAAYVAMAIEAFVQAHGCVQEVQQNFKLSKIRFKEALVLEAETNDAVEILTEMRPIDLNQVSGQCSSRFTILTIHGEDHVIHCTGKINRTGKRQHFCKIKTDRKDRREPEAFYAKLSGLGLCYGPTFSLFDKLEVPSDGITNEAEGSFTAPGISLHPAHLDSMLQLGFLAKAAGRISNIQGALPVEIGSIFLQHSSSCNHQHTLHTISRVQSEGRKMLLDASLECDCSGLQVHMSDVAFAQYSLPGARNEDREDMIHQVLWKPDLTYIRPILNQQSFHDFLLKATKRFRNDGARSGLSPASLVILDLVMHKAPESNIVCFGDFDDQQKSIIQDLVRHGDTQRLSYSVLFCRDQEEILSLDQAPEVLACGQIDDPALLLDAIARVPAPPTPSDLTLVIEDISCSTLLQKYGFDILSRGEDPKHVFATRRGTDTQKIPAGMPKRNLVLVTARSKKLTAFEQSLTEALLQFSVRIEHVFPLGDLSDETEKLQGADLLVAAELSETVFASIDQVHFAAIKAILARARTVIWLSDGDVLGKCQALEFAASTAFLRTMRLEYFPIRIASINLDLATASAETTAAYVSTAFETLLTSADADDELVISDGLVYCSRFALDLERNAQYHSRDPRVRLMSRKAVQDGVIDYNENAGIRGPFIREQAIGKNMDSGDIDLQVEAAVSFSMNTEETSNKSPRSGAWISIGNVTNVGAETKQITKGASILALSTATPRTRLRLQESACCQIDSTSTDWRFLSGLLAYVSARFAIEHSLRLREGETIVIDNAQCAVGRSAIRCAKRLKATVIAIVRSRLGATSLVLNEADQILHHSTDNSCTKSILDATEGHGASALLTILDEQITTPAWEWCAAFGRSAAFGSRTALAQDDKDRLFDFLGRNGTHGDFDLWDIVQSGGNLQSVTPCNLLARAVAEQDNLADIDASVVRFYELGNTAQKPVEHRQSLNIEFDVLSMGVSADLVPAVPDLFQTSLDCHKVYILVGCFGGLGRSLARWMAQRGARHFVFVARSGASTGPARNLVGDLETADCHVHVVKGSVCDSDTMEAALRISRGRLGGIVHAAMTGHEGLFADMSHADWSATVDPKIKGAWTIHNSLAKVNEQPDFFVMVSSIAGSVGQASEGPYTTANGFLDYFARFRRLQGNPAIAIALGAIAGVGYLAEHPGQEELLRKLGWSPLTEDEMLRLIDFAILQDTTARGSYERNVQQAHILTGIGGQSLERHMRHLMRDPRAIQLKLLMHQRNANEPQNASETQGSHGRKSEDDLIALQIKTARKNKDAKAMLELVEPMVTKGLAKLVQMEPAALKPSTKLMELGMDSLIAVEARQSATLGVNIPVVDFMASATVGSITNQVVEGLLDAKES